MYVNKSILSCQLLSRYVSMWRKNWVSLTSRSKPLIRDNDIDGPFDNYESNKISQSSDLVLFFWQHLFFFHLCLNCPVGTFLKSSDVDKGRFSRNKLNACSTVFSVSLVVVIHFHETMSKLSCLLDYTLSVYWYWAFNPDSINSLVIHTSNYFFLNSKIPTSVRSPLDLYMPVLFFSKKYAPKIINPLKIHILQYSNYLIFLRLK